MLQAYEKYASARYTATRANDRYVYVLTEVAEGEERGAGIVGIDLASGQSDRSVMLKDKEPDYQVDERAGRLFNLKGKKELVAYSLR